MKTVTKQTRQNYRTKGSRFIGTLFYSENTEQFEQILEEQKRAHPSATHHCYAWRFFPENPEEFTQDDGEPAGTAGMPILNQLKSAELVNCGCIVVRYYGGTNLGRSGLIDAYARTAGLCIDAVRRPDLVPTRLIKIRYPYEVQNLIEKWIRNFELKEKEAVYLEDVTLTVACSKNRSTAFFGELERNGYLLYSFKELGISFEIKE